MTVIFLDIDGILNDRTYLDQEKDIHLICPDCLERLKRIAAAGIAELVQISQLERTVRKFTISDKDRIPAKVLILFQPAPFLILPSLS